MTLEAPQRRQPTGIPFGPFVLAAAFLALAAGDRIAEVYLHLTDLW